MAILKLVPYTRYAGLAPDIANEQLIRNAIYYITNKESNPDHRYGGYNFVCGTADEIIAQFLALNRYYHRANHIPIRHIVLSLDSYNEYFITPYQLERIVNRFCLDMFGDEYQVAYGIHENTANLHAHIIVNTVNFHTGLLLPWNYTMEQRIYETMKLILRLNSYWKGAYPITRLKMCYS